MLRVVHAEVFPWPWETLPDRVESDQLWPEDRDTIPFASFGRTPYDDMPDGYATTEPIVAHYREDLARYPRRLLVFANGGCMVPWVDEYHPEFGFEVEYLAIDAGRRMSGEWEGDARLPYDSETSLLRPEAESEAVATAPPEDENLSQWDDDPDHPSAEEVVVPHIAVHVLPDTLSPTIVGGIPTGLAWGQKAPSRAFLEKVVAIADEVDTDPSFLLTQFWGESGFNPQAHLNSHHGLHSSTDPATIGKHTIGGGLFGLMRQWAKVAVGVSFSDFMEMTALEQLDYARKFYLGAKGKLQTMGDVFIYTFYPAALGKKDSYIIGRKGEPAYDSNAHFDINKDGTLTKGEATAHRYALYQAGMKDGNRLDYADLAAFEGKVGDAITRPASIATLSPETVAGASQLMAVPPSLIGAVAESRRAPQSEESFRLFATVQARLMLNDILDLCCQDLEDQAEAGELTRNNKKLLRRLTPRLLSEEALRRLQLAETYYVDGVHRDGNGETYLAFLQTMADQLVAKKKRTTNETFLLFGLDHVIELQELSEETSPVDMDQLLDESEMDYIEKLEEWEGVLAKLLLRSKR